MNQSSDMIGALEIGDRQTITDGVLLAAALATPMPTQPRITGGTCIDDSALEYASGMVVSGPTSMNAGCKNSVFACVGLVAE